MNTLRSAEQQPTATPRSGWVTRFLTDPSEPLTEEEQEWLNLVDQNTLWSESESRDDNDQ